MSSARALWAVAPGVCALREQALAAPGADEVEVEAVWGAISRGTEGLVLAGRVPPSEHGRMRGPHMQGDFPFPVAYGYCSAGRVVGGALPVGTEVFCLHPHQDRYVVRVGDVVPLPAGTPLARAVLGPNVETALNVVWDAAIGPGDRVAVVGGGVVGSLVAWLAAGIPGTSVQLVDPVDRGAVAAALGARHVRPEAAEGDCDVVVHASGHPDGAVTALGLAGVEALVVEASWFGAREVPLPLGGAFHSRRLRYRSSQVGRLPPERAPRWTYRRRMTMALTLAADPALEVLLDEVVPFEALPERLPALVAPGATGLCHRVRYGGSPADGR